MFNQKLMQRFCNPSYAGSIKNASAVGVATSKFNANKVKFFLQIENDKIVDAKFKAFGGVLCIACCDLAAQKLVGKTLIEAQTLTNFDFCDEAQDVEPSVLQASVFCEEAIKNAIAVYQKKLSKTGK